MQYALSRVLFAVIALGILAVTMTGCSDGCGKGERRVTVGYNHFYVPGHVVGKVSYPGHMQTTPITECRR